MARFTPSIPPKRPVTSGKKHGLRHAGGQHKKKETRKIHSRGLLVSFSILILHHKSAALPSALPLGTPCAVSFINAGLMARAFLAVFMHQRSFQMDAEVPIKPIGWRWVRHVGHRMHARCNRFAIVGHPNWPSVPGEPFKALDHASIIGCDRFAVRMIPPAKTPRAEALASAHIRYGKFRAFCKPVRSAFKPIQQDNASLKPIKLRIIFFDFVAAVINRIAGPAMPSAESPHAC